MIKFACSIFIPLSFLESNSKGRLELYVESHLDRSLFVFISSTSQESRIASLGLSFGYVLCF